MSGMLLSSLFLIPISSIINSSEDYYFNSAVYLFTIPILIEGTIAAITYNNIRKDLHNTVLDVGAGNISFTEGLNSFNIFYEKLHNWNLFNGIAYITSGLANAVVQVIIVAYTVSDLEYDNKELVDTCSILGILLSNTFLIIYGIFLLTELGNKLPDKDIYTTNNFNKFDFDFNLFPVFNENMQFNGYGLNLWFRW
jgi:hypothetical protein